MLHALASPFSIKCPRVEYSPIPAQAVRKARRACATGGHRQRLMMPLKAERKIVAQHTDEMTILQ